MTIEQTRERMLGQIQDRWDEFKAEEKELFDAWIAFIKFHTTIELALSLGLIDMGEYLKWDTDGDHLYHDKYVRLNPENKKKEED